MDYIKEWTFSICATLIVAVILSFVSPSGTMGKFYKTIISLFIVASFLFPIVSAFGEEQSFSFDDFKLSQSEIDREDAMNFQIENIVKKSLEKGGYSGCNVNANTTIKDDEIIINSLQIAAPDEYDIKSIQEYVLKNTGYNAKIIHIGD